MKKYLLLLVFAFLVSCSEDEDKKDVLTFNGTETYVFVSEVEDVQVYDINGKVSDPMLWDSNLVASKYEFDNDLAYNYTEFKINNNFVFITDGVEEDSIPILIEDNIIYSDDAFFGFKIKIFDILNDGELQNSAVMFASKTVENDIVSIYAQSTNFSYTEYDEEYNQAKSNISDGGYVALFKQKRTYAKTK